MSWYLVCLVVGVMLLSNMSKGSAIDGQVYQFDSIWEPSAVQQLPDGRLIVVEDEKFRSISVARVDIAGRLSTVPLKRRLIDFKAVGKPVLGKIEDLEGVAVDATGHVYAIASHSKTIAGLTDKGRKKFVRFQVEGERLVNPVVVSNLKKKIIRKHGLLAKAISGSQSRRGSGFDIEGLSFDKNKQKLLIGLRSPVIDGKAVVAVLENPAGVFNHDEKVAISDELIFLDLDKGGIRSITFDPKLGGYLIISRRENKKGKAFKLWFWSGDTRQSPRRVRMPESINLDHAEGITPVRVEGRDRIFLVFDNGNSLKRVGGHYLMLNYDQLVIDHTS